MRINIIGGIISSAIFLILFQPILNWLNKILLNFLANSFSGLIDFLYSKAARSQVNTINLTLLGLLAGILLGLLIAFILVILLKKSRNRFKEKLFAMEESKQKKVLLIMFLIAAVLAVFPVNFSYFTEFVNVEMNTSFNQRLTIIAPYITEQEEEQIRADWASMETRLHYAAINSKIESIAIQNKITLPKAF